jgi:peptidoglycan/xylan/chitin deacetylase (PgdA/CDA1 family)
MLRVPILMYHSVSDHQDWLWGHLSCPVKVFEDHVRTLANGGFTAISLQEWYDHLQKGASLPPKPVLLTFDDGYLDNWVYAYPILKRYGFKGTIFVCPEFVDPTETLRPNLDDVQTGRVTGTGLKSIGFLSWREMSVMESDGVMDIQSHALTHTWYYSGEQIIDWHHPGDPYPWLAWNTRPERKYLWMNEDQSLFVPWGTPIYVHERSLKASRYFPDPNLTDLFLEYVDSRGGKLFFQRPDWQDELSSLVQQHHAPNNLHYRSEGTLDYEARVRYELGASKEIISSKVRKSVHFLCWPGGAYTRKAEHIAHEVGYWAMTLSSEDPRRTILQPDRLIRCGAPTLQWPGKAVYRDGRYLLAMLRCGQGRVLACLECKLLTVRDLLWFGCAALFGRIIKENESP